MRAIGFRAKPGSHKLRPVRGAADHLLEFTLPPQHFAERTIGVDKIPDVFEEAVLKLISLAPGRPSTLVFRVPNESIRLKIEELLNWPRFQLLMPDASKWGEKYDFEIPRNEGQRVSRMEFPFGIELTPIPGGPNLTFSGSVHPNATQNWSELWSTVLQQARPEERRAPLRMEIFSVRGFKKIGQTGSIEDGTYVVSYVMTLDDPLPPEQPPIEKWERAELAASLSPRFPYTGRVDPKRASAQLHLKGKTSFIAAHQAGSAITVNQLRLSSRGGFIDLVVRFDPYPGSALSGWTHSSTQGRDTFVQILREGFLFPFGTPCQLIGVSQRVFGKDEKGYFVAPLVKQAFLRVKPNRLDFDHGESPFRSLTVTTEETPPLDLPKSGNPADYGQYDFFMPKVDRQPFPFDHLGTDWAGEQHRSSMPMFFVSNRARTANGLIFEPGYEWPPDPPGPVFDPAYSIPKNGEGLRVVDRKWSLEPGRFASYAGAVVNLAKSEVSKNSAQKLDWVEWVRGNIPDLKPKVAPASPFRPRARTMRIQPQASAHLSGETSAMLVTYRDIRFTSQPFLDPEPTTPPSDYFMNVTADIDDRNTPYLYFLETRPLIGETKTPAPRSPQQIPKDVRDLYFKTTNPASAPTTLFEGINNEIQFGRQEPTDGIGGLSVPDTHANILNREFGVIGDAAFNERRWPGFAKAKPKLEPANRLDFAALAKTRKPLDESPFEDSQTPEMRADRIAAARALMGYPKSLALTSTPTPPGAFAPNLKLGDLFGTDAELIPGLRFADIFAEIALAGADETQPSPLIGDGRGQQAAEPLAWAVKLTGIEWLSALQEAGEDAPPLVTILADMIRNARPEIVPRPLTLGLEATLNWSNEVFKRVEVGPAVFIPEPGQTKIQIDAAARIDLGVPVIEQGPPRLSFAPGKPKITATTEVVSFAVEIFNAIRLNFDSVAFTISEDGSKSFSTKLGSVELLPPLDFISQLQDMLGGLGGDSGIKVEISPQRARISQTLQFPEGDEPLLIGPAQVTNLALSWAVTIPLMGRDVLSVAFAISSREKPLTIYVPPWYGGKAYVLVEATTRGCRLVEISMEYGALIPINWGPARGQASLTAGLFYKLQRLDASDSAKVELTGFVKAAANLSVAGIIHFTGLILIVLSYIDGGRIIRGQALISVSIKIGFVRYSYSFTATHEKEKAERASGPGPARIARFNGRTACADAPAIAAFPYGQGFSAEARAARNRLLAGYRREGPG